MNEFFFLNEKHDAVACSQDVYAELYSRDMDRVVATTDIAYLARVSTIFLGINHNFDEKGPPLLFETMIFWEDKRRSEYQQRYSTWEEALAGHTKALRVVDKVERPLLARVRRFMFGEDQS